MKENIVCLIIWVLLMIHSTWFHIRRHTLHSDIRLDDIFEVLLCLIMPPAGYIITVIFYPDMEESKIVLFKKRKKKRIIKNAKQELLEALKTLGSKIKCAYIFFDFKSGKKSILLKDDYTNEDYGIFLANLNFDYDPDGIHRYMRGIVWLDTGGCLHRTKIGDEMCWQYSEWPKIPKELLPD